MNLKYNWNNDLRVKLFLEKIYCNSLKKLEEANYQTSYADEFVMAVEDFLCCVKIFSYDFDRILDLLSSVEYIGFMMSLRIDNDNLIKLNYHYMPPVVNFGTYILINPQMDTDTHLSDIDRRKMYIFHGLANSVLNFQNETTLRFSEMYNNLIPMKYQDTSKITYSGWLLLEETLAQEIAERFIYFINGKNRLGITLGGDVLDKRIVSSEKISSNLEYFRTFQELLIRFGLTIPAVGDKFEYSRERIIHDLIKKSLNGNLAIETIAYYIDNDNEIMLYQMLYSMGLLLNEKNRLRNMPINKTVKLTEDESNSLYDDLIRLLNRLVSLDNQTYSDIDDFSNIPLNIFAKKRILTLIQTKKIDLE